MRHRTIAWRAEPRRAAGARACRRPAVGARSSAAVASSAVSSSVPTALWLEERAARFREER